MTFAVRHPLSRPLATRRAYLALLGLLVLSLQWAGLHHHVELDAHEAGEVCEYCLVSQAGDDGDLPRLVPVQEPAVAAQAVPVTAVTLTSTFTVTTRARAPPARS